MISESVVRVEGKLIKERNNLVPMDHMFFGFRSLSMFQNNFMYFNGIRILMKPPMHPCKLGLYLNVTVKEYEHFTVRWFHSTSHRDSFLTINRQLQACISTMSFPSSSS